MTAPTFAWTEPAPFLPAAPVGEAVEELELDEEDVAVPVGVAEVAGYALPAVFTENGWDVA